MDGQLVGGLVTSNRSQVPEGLSGKRDHVGAEVLCLADDADQVSSHPLKNDLICNRLVETDGGHSLKDRNHRVDRGTSNGVVCQKTNQG